MKKMHNPISKAIFYYFLAVSLKGLLQTLRLYSGLPQDLVRCSDIEVSNQLIATRIFCNYIQVFKEDFTFDATGLAMSMDNVK